MKILVLVEVSDGIVERARLFADKKQAEVAFEEYTGVAYQDFLADPERHVKEAWDQTKLFDVDMDDLNLEAVVYVLVKVRDLIVHGVDASNDMNDLKYAFKEWTGMSYAKAQRDPERLEDYDQTTIFIACEDVEV